MLLSTGKSHKVELTICGDRDRLIRVMTNLLSNAFEAISDRGDVYISARGVKSGIEIKVTDTGRGMPHRVKEAIFEPFSTYGKRNGTGLGMSIVKTIIDLHRGTIDVQSTLGKGTVITIWIPNSIQT